VHDLSLSVVIMAFNEEACLPIQLDRTLRYLRANVRDFEILVVDDGSVDATAEIVRRTALCEPRVRLLSHSRNLGMGRAIRTGYRAATKEWVTQLPADGQVPPETLEAFIGAAKEVDLVLSVYDRRGDGLTRALLSASYRVVGRVVLGARADYTGTMLFRRALLDSAPLFSDTFFVNLEFPLQCLGRGVTHKIVTFRPAPRLAGRSKVATARRIARVAAEMVAMRVRLARGIYERHAQGDGWR